jgi:hypothetical protein
MLLTNTVFHKVGKSRIPYKALHRKWVKFLHLGLQGKDTLLPCPTPAAAGVRPPIFGKQNRQAVAPGVSARTP